jgi:hypothetical protein
VGLCTIGSLSVLISVFFSDRQIVIMPAELTNKHSIPEARYFDAMEKTKFLELSGKVPPLTNKLF